MSALNAESVAAIKTQVEFYFSRDNLMVDTFLVSHMDENHFVPIDVIAEVCDVCVRSREVADFSTTPSYINPRVTPQFNRIKRLAQNRDVVVAALRASKACELDEVGQRVRPRFERDTIILREMGPDTTEAQVRQLFAQPDGTDSVSSLRQEVGDTWFVTLCDGDAAQAALGRLREQQFNGQSIKARLKSASAPLLAQRRPAVPAVVAAAAAPLPMLAAVAPPTAASERPVAASGSGIEGPDSAAAAAGGEALPSVAPSSEEDLQLMMSMMMSMMMPGMDVYATPEQRAQMKRLQQQMLDMAAAGEQGAGSSYRGASRRGGRGEGTEAFGSPSRGRGGARGGGRGRGAGSVPTPSRGAGASAGASTRGAGEAAGGREARYPGGERGARRGRGAGAAGGAGRGGSNSRGRARHGSHSGDDEVHAAQVVLTDESFPPLPSQQQGHRGVEGQEAAYTGYAGSFNQYAHEDILMLAKHIPRSALARPSGMDVGLHGLVVRAEPHEDLAVKQRTVSMDAALRHGRPARTERAESLDYASMMYGEESEAVQERASRKKEVVQEAAARRERGTGAGAAHAGAVPQPTGYAAALLAPAKATPPTTTAVAAGAPAAAAPSAGTVAVPAAKRAAGVRAPAAAPTGAVAAVAGSDRREGGKTASPGKRAAPAVAQGGARGSARGGADKGGDAAGDKGSHSGDKGRSASAASAAAQGQGAGVWGAKKTFASVLRHPPAPTPAGSTPTSVTAEQVVVGADAAATQSTPAQE